MSYKTILVHLELNGDNEGVLSVAGQLAERFGSRVITKQRPGSENCQVFFLANDHRCQAATKVTGGSKMGL